MCQISRLGIEEGQGYLVPKFKLKSIVSLLYTVPRSAIHFNSNFETKYLWFSSILIFGASIHIGDLNNVYLVFFHAEESLYTKTR